MGPMMVAPQSWFCNQTSVSDRFIINDAFESDGLLTPLLLLQQIVIPLQLTEEASRPEQVTPLESVGEQQNGFESPLQVI
jgi:hypothetical protein